MKDLPIIVREYRDSHPGAIRPSADQLIRWLWDRARTAEERVARQTEMLNRRMLQGRVL